MGSKGLTGRPVRLLMSFDSRVLCTDGDTPHAAENLRVTVLFWEFVDFDDEHRDKHREQLGDVFEQSKELARRVSRTGLPLAPGHVVIQKVLKLQPQVSSICWN